MTPATFDLPAATELLAARARRRLAPVASGAALTVLFVAFGGLAWVWGLVGLALLLLWAIGWPEANGPVAASEATGARSTGDLQPTLRALLGGIPDAAVLIDEFDRVLEANALAEPLLPTGARRTVALLSRAPELLEAIATARDTGKPQTCAIRTRAPVERHMSVLVTPLALPQPSLLLVLHDRTEAEQLAEMRADFVANASHELRTPLAALKGFVETLQGAAKDDAAARDRFLGIMNEQATRMARLIEDLLSLSRIEMHEHVAPTGRVDLVAVAASAAQTLAREAEAAGIRIEWAAPGEPLVVAGDHDELMQVVTNLIHNAIKYGRRGGRATLTVGRNGGRIVLTVDDDGIGIASEHIPRLTERFYRVSARESRERGGTGLGLAIVKHIVNRHRGELSIAAAPGKGSRFTVALPAT